MSFISGTVGAIMGSSAQKKAARENRQAVEDTNRINLQMFQEGRGSAGSALLPMYFGTRERDLGEAAGNAALNLFPKDIAALKQEYENLLSSQQGNIDAGNQAISDIFTGNLLLRKLTEAEPVFDARLGLAQSQADAIDVGANRAINAMNAAEAAKGYTGAGSFANNNLAASLIDARARAAAAIAAANLENAAQKKQMQDANDELLLRSLDLPVARMATLTAAKRAPTSAITDEINAALGPLSFFKMAPGAFKADAPPMQDPIPSAAQLAMQGISQTGGAVLNAYLGSKGTLFGGKGWA